MEESYIVLLIILILGLFMKNESIAIASCALILLKLLKLNFLFPILENNGLKIGIIILTIGILSPIAAAKYSLMDIWVALKSPIGISAVIGGAIVILFTSKGYTLLSSEPIVVIPIIVGSILGIILFKGIPVGPLVAAGITVIIYNLYKFIQKVIL